MKDVAEEDRPGERVQEKIMCEVPGSTLHWSGRRWRAQGRARQMFHSNKAGKLTAVFFVRQVLLQLVADVAANVEEAL
jgi:hypothetical protein